MNQDEVVCIVTALVIAGLIALMMWAWTRRARAQGHLYDHLPALPDELGDPVLAPLTGVYVGSTIAGYWQERINREPLGFRSEAVLTAYPGGIALAVSGATVWIPGERIESVRRDSRLAGKVIPGQGLLVVRWRLDGEDGPTLLDSGLRADDKDHYDDWLARWPAPADDAAPAHQSHHEETP